MERPKTRADCPSQTTGSTFCPWIDCRYHLAVEVLGRHFSDAAMAEWLASRAWHCVLDAVESNGAMTLQETGDLLELTRERARQLETTAMQKLVLAAPRQLGSFLELSEGDVSAIKARLRRQMATQRREMSAQNRLLRHISVVLGRSAKQRMKLRGAERYDVLIMVTNRYGIRLGKGGIDTVGDVVHAVLAILRTRPEPETTNTPSQG